jgi:hypothetical protein
VKRQFLDSLVKSIVLRVVMRLEVSSMYRASSIRNNARWLRQEGERLDIKPDTV